MSRNGSLTRGSWKRGRTAGNGRSDAIVAAVVVEKHSEKKAFAVSWS